MTNQRNRTQSLEFRQQEVGYVMERWRASDSCSLIGVGSVGKSNLLHHLSDPDVQDFYMKDVAGGKLFKAIIIDPSMLGALPSESTSNSEVLRCWAGYELMMHRLFLAFYPFDYLPAGDIQVFYETYQALQDGSNPLYAYMGLRYFELGLEIFMKQGIQIVFMFDEFEEMLKQLPVKFFLTLRGLRDANKRKLSYLTFTRTSLRNVTDHLGINQLDIEPFTELFNDSIVYVGPYNEIDGRKMVQDLMERNNRKYEAYALEFLLWATGRYAGLLRSGFRALEGLGEIEADTIMTQSERLVNDLTTRRSIRSECKTIWMSLSDKERIMLREFTSQRPSIDTSDLETQQVFAVLQQKQLLKVQGNRVIIDPPIFQSFVKNNPDGEI
jgi:hypothetical protein